MSLQKRLFDVTFAGILGVLLAPVILGFAGWLWWRQGGPIFYGSERMKTASESFRLWKFRTMESVAKDRGVSGGDKSARITPAGAWLRARRLDELPQLWNIVKGDMSFVGPRPPLKEYVIRFPGLYKEILQSRPGVTGLATLHFHHHEARLLAQCTSPEDTDAVYARACVPRKARLDMIYQRHQSLAFDLKLILRTIGYAFGR